MGRHSVRTAVTLGAAALLTAGLGTASAAPAASPAATHTPPAHAGQRQPKQPVLVDCLWHPQARPDAFILACGDGNSRLSALHWSQWNARSAVAKGVNFVNDCKPYCAAGKFHAYPVVVRLEHPKPWKKHPQVQHFTQITLVFPGARPDVYGRVVRLPLWD
ncbi:hypothetical protein ACH4UM_32180 [Streptomyces sp. NPDC020801]|uniref:hypothetical protein n=1 Tax=unclassified Streptomyces TaxID=2593676 RepID=UPI0037BDCFC3